ncbi:hypothetical protein ACTFIY_004587 [Dictyostelium cf. discoideum]
MDEEIIHFNKQIEDINKNYISIEIDIEECLQKVFNNDAWLSESGTIDKIKQSLSKFDILKEKESPQYSNDLETGNSQRFISSLLKTISFTKEIEYLETISNDIQLMDLTELGPEIENTIKRVNEIKEEQQNLSKLNENITSFKRWEKEISNKLITLKMEPLIQISMR